MLLLFQAQGTQAVGADFTAQWSSVQSVAADFAGGFSSVMGVGADCAVAWTVDGLGTVSADLVAAWRVADGEPEALPGPDAVHEFWKRCTAVGASLECAWRIEAPVLPVHPARVVQEQETPLDLSAATELIVKVRSAARERARQREDDEALAVLLALLD